MNEKITNEQKNILNYLETRYLGCQFDIVGKTIIKIKDTEGKTKVFTCNPYGDILDADTNEIIAISDLPHDIEKIGTKKPSRWEDK